MYLCFVLEQRKGCERSSRPRSGPDRLRKPMDRRKISIGTVLGETVDEFAISPGECIVNHGWFTALELTAQSFAHSMRRTRSVQRRGQELLFQISKQAYRTYSPSARTKIFRIPIFHVDADAEPGTTKSICSPCSLFEMSNVVMGTRSCRFFQ